MLPVYTQGNRTDTFIGTENLPALTQFTIGMWFYGKPDITSDFLTQVFISFFGEWPFLFNQRSHSVMLYVFISNPCVREILIINFCSLKLQENLDSH